MTRARWTQPYAVYPRGCGGTELIADFAMVDTGLSPRVRGNPELQAERQHLLRSIPAGAGEPKPESRSAWQRGVYPRGCGGTRTCARSVSLPLGLSPRVRGNHLERPRQDQPHGSIPAGAGEPGWLPSATRFMRVYPRGCGGTSCQGGHHAV